MPDHVALLRKSETGGYAVSYPDFPDCSTKADTLDEARMMASEALNLHILDMARDRKTVPSPTALDEIVADHASSRPIVLMVFVPDPKAKHVCISATLPHDLLAQFDKSAQQRGISRSEFLTLGGQKMLASE